MNNIYLLGDTHGYMNTIVQMIQKEDIHDDVVIILGDFGFIWNGDTKGLFKLQKRFEQRNCMLAFIDGNHENFERLYKYPTETWNGGQIHRIAANIVHLMRGEVFTIFGKTFFAMGGANSIDKESRVNRIHWWAEEDITYADMENANKNLALCGDTVDYVLTHTCPLEVKKAMKMKIEYDNSNEQKLQMIADVLTFDWWYFGHYHKDWVYDKYTCLWQDYEKIAL